MAGNSDGDGVGRQKPKVTKYENVGLVEDTPSTLFLVAASLSLRNHYSCHDELCPTNDCVHRTALEEILLNNVGLMPPSTLGEIRQLCVARNKVWRSQKL